MKKTLNQLVEERLISKVYADSIEAIIESLPDECSLKKWTRFIKVQDEEGDFHPIGAKGTVVGSRLVGSVECYFVLFDDPKIEYDNVDHVIIGIMGYKIAAL